MPIDADDRNKEYTCLFAMVRDYSLYNTWHCDQLWPKPGDLPCAKTLAKPISVLGTENLL